MPVEPHVYARELAQGALYGLLTALAFALWPLGRAHDVPVSALFRDQVEPDAHWPRKRYMVMVALAVVALAGSAILLSFDRRIAVAAVVGTAAAFVLLRLVAFAITGIAARLPRPRRTELRMAVANIHRPGALTPSLVLSLGLGVTLLVTLAVIDSTIRSQLSRSIPQKAPSFFFLDVPSTEAERFDAFLAKEAPGAKVERVPMMRGRVAGGKGRAGERDQGRRKRRLGAGRRSRHHLFRHRAGGLARGRGRVVARRLHRAADWSRSTRSWRKGIGLAIGDTITVNVLGRSMTAKVANLRRVEWQSLGINFVMVFSPSTFAGAPHTNLSTLTFPGGASNERESALLAAAGREFPNVTSVRVKDALDAINDVVGQLAVAIRGASSVALIASILVLAGALAAGHRSRVYDAVVLKTLGATRGRLLAAFLLEYGILGARHGHIRGGGRHRRRVVDSHPADEAWLRMAHGRPARCRRCCDCRYNSTRAGGHVAYTWAEASALSTKFMSIIMLKTVQPVQSSSFLFRR